MVVVLICQAVIQLLATVPDGILNFGMQQGQEDKEREKLRRKETENEQKTKRGHTLQ